MRLTSKLLTAAMVFERPERIEIGFNTRRDEAHDEDQIDFPINIPLFGGILVANKLFSCPSYQGNLLVTVYIESSHNTDRYENYPNFDPLAYAQRSTLTLVPPEMDENIWEYQKALSKQKGNLAWLKKPLEKDTLDYIQELKSQDPTCGILTKLKKFIIDEKEGGQDPRLLKALHGVKSFVEADDDGIPF